MKRAEAKAAVQVFLMHHYTKPRSSLSESELAEKQILEKNLMTAQSHEAAQKWAYKSGRRQKIRLICDTKGPTGQKLFWKFLKKKKVKSNIEIVKTKENVLISDDDECCLYYMS